MLRQINHRLMMHLDNKWLILNAPWPYYSKVRGNIKPANSHLENHFYVSYKTLAIQLPNTLCSETH